MPASRLTSQNFPRKLRTGSPPALGMSSGPTVIGPPNPPIFRSHMKSSGAPSRPTASNEIPLQKPPRMKMRRVITCRRGTGFAIGVSTTSERAALDAAGTPAGVALGPSASNAKPPLSRVHFDVPWRDQRLPRPPEEAPNERQRQIGRHDAREHDDEYVTPRAHPAQPEKHVDDEQREEDDSAQRHHLLRHDAGDIQMHVLPEVETAIAAIDVVERHGYVPEVAGPVQLAVARRIAQYLREGHAELEPLRDVFARHEALM